MWAYDIAEKEGPIRQLMQVSRVDGDLQGTYYAGVKYGGCTRESGARNENGGCTTTLAIVAR